MLLTRLSSPSSIQVGAKMTSGANPDQDIVKSKYGEWIRDNPILTRSDMFTDKGPDGSTHKRPDGKVVEEYRSDEAAFSEILSPLQRILN